MAVKNQKEFKLNMWP